MSLTFLCAIITTTAAQKPDVESRILTYKQYAKIEHDVPYVLEFKVGKGALLIYGGRHVFNPADPQITDIQKEWDAFKPDVPYNEGGNSPTERTMALITRRKPWTSSKLPVAESSRS
jgi:hypothetical protein